MKYGYSILLGETLAARDIDYGDCGKGQVICPECRDPVFKGIRADTDTHYLSHYQASGPVELACVLRVDAMGEEDVRRQNETTRAQTLYIYYAGIDEMLAPGLEKLGVTAGLLRAVRRSKTASALLDFIESEMRQIDIDIEINTAIAEHKSMEEEAEETGTKLSDDSVDKTSAHYRVCREMLRLLLSPKGAKGLRRLTTAAWAKCMAFDPDGDRTDNQTAMMLDKLARIRDFLTKATHSSRNGGRMFLASMQTDGALLNQYMDAMHAIESFARTEVTHLDYIGHLQTILKDSPSLAQAAVNARKRAEEADRLMRNVTPLEPAPEKPEDDARIEQIMARMQQGNIPPFLRA